MNWKRTTPVGRTGADGKRRSEKQYRHNDTSTAKRKQSNHIDFADVNRRCMAAMPGLVFQLVPGGMLRGAEYVVRNPTRADRKPGSFKINVKTGQWADFADPNATGGDVIALAAYLHGTNQGQAARYLASLLGVTAPCIDAGRPYSHHNGAFVVRNPAADDAERTARAVPIYQEAVSLAGTIGEAYLRRRIGKGLPIIADVRFHPHCVRGTDDGIEHHPALVALLRDAQSNEPRAIHRTYLKPDGSDRLRGDFGKKALGPTAGAVIKLVPDDCVTTGTGLCEGLEKSIALLAIGWSPIWCSTGTSNMAAFSVLEGIEALTIFADHDEPGQKAAASCAKRWSDAGKEVVIRTPHAADADWSDVLVEAVS